MTFHETNELTPEEVNILKEQDKVFVTSNYTKSVFESHGLSNVIYCPLGFDASHFRKIDLSDEKDEGVIVFGLRGKLEKRKHTLKILSAWVKAFGANPKYRIDCSIYNPHIPQDIQQQMIYSAFPHGEMPFNVNMLPSVQENSKYNLCLNAADIDLTGMSGCEGFNLPLFQSLCLGKHAVVLNAHVHKDFCNAANSILVEPNGVLDADDGFFFKKGQPFNQGTWFDFDEDSLIEAMRVAVERFEANNNNEVGERLKDEFTYQRTVDTIIKNIK